MSPPAPTPIAAPPADLRAPARALIERQLLMLTELAEIGMAIARAAGRRATAEDGDGAPHAADPGLTFSRAARAVRLTIALQQRLSQDLAALDRADGLARTAEAGRRRDRIHRAVEHAIEAALDDEDEVERLSSDAWERLTEAEDDDLADLPLGEAVARICRELGVAPAPFAAAFAEPEAGEADPFAPITTPPPIYGAVSFAAGLPSPSMGEGRGLGVLAPASG